MRTAQRLQRLESPLAVRLRLHSLWERLCQLGESEEARTLYASLTDAETLGILKYDRWRYTQHYGKESVEREMEESGEYHPEWIDWFLDGKFDWQDLKQRAEEAMEVAEEGIE